MHEYVLTLLAAGAVTYLLTPLVRRFAITVGALHAARERDVHVVPTPLLGGFAMYAGLAAGLLVASRLPGLDSAFAGTNMSKGLLLAGALVVIMGFVDDRWGMGALSKLAGQVAAGVILVWSGAEVTWLPAPSGGTLGLTSDQQIAATVLVVVVTINAVNFIDGLDGLAAGIAGIGAAAFFVYYYTLTNRLGLSDQTGPALASAVLVGVCLGFLPHNFYPARIFMGDTGSMLIGLLLAYAPISSLASLDPGSLTASHPVNRFGAILPLLLPAAVLLIPYADLLMAVIRRVRAGMSVFAPDKKHLQHRLLAIGHSHRTSVLIMYLWAALFAGGVVWLSIVRTPLFVLAIVTVGAMLALLLVSMPRLRFWNRPVTANGEPARPAPAAPSRPASGARSRAASASRPRSASGTRSRAASASRSGSASASRSGSASPGPALPGPALPGPALPGPPASGSPASGPPASGPPAPEPTAPARQAPAPPPAVPTPIPDYARPGPPHLASEPPGTFRASGWPGFPTDAAGSPPEPGRLPAGAANLAGVPPYAQEDPTGAGHGHFGLAPELPALPPEPPTNFPPERSGFPSERSPGFQQEPSGFPPGPPGFPPESPANFPPGPSGFAPERSPGFPPEPPGFPRERSPGFQQESPGFASEPPGSLPESPGLPSGRPASFGQGSAGAPHESDDVAPDPEGPIPVNQSLPRATRQVPILRGPDKPPATPPG